MEICSGNFIYSEKKVFDGDFDKRKHAGALENCEFEN